MKELFFLILVSGKSANEQTPERPKQKTARNLQKRKEGWKLRLKKR